MMPASEQQSRWLVAAAAGSFGRAAAEASNSKNGAVEYETQRQ